MKSLGRKAHRASLRAVRAVDVILSAGFAAFVATLVWAERPPVPAGYFEGAWRRDNPRCEGGAETLRFEGPRRLHWADEAGHRATARYRFTSTSRLEGLHLEVEGTGADNPTPCGWQAATRLAAYILPTEDRRGWYFVQDPENPWRRAGESAAP